MTEELPSALLPAGKESPDVEDFPGRTVAWGAGWEPSASPSTRPSLAKVAAWRTQLFHVLGKQVIHS